MILKKRDSNFAKLINFYFQNKKQKKKIKKQIKKMFYFSLSLNKKLVYYRFTWRGRIYTFTNGQIIKKRLKILKFYKKTIKSFGLTIAMLNRGLHKRLKFVKFLYCKNFCYKNYMWLKKYIYLVKPTIETIFITNSWNLITKKR